MGAGHVAQSYCLTDRTCPVRRQLTPLDRRMQSGTHQGLIHSSIDAKRPLRPIGAIVLRGECACRGEEVCKHSLGEHDGGAEREKPMGAASGSPIGSRAMSICTDAFG
jgi:hypothetical protein